ncbi:YecA family protein [Ottowia testudinis]|uniref:UPF0149 family protein n=1 Tax=Ottowia testudinis TaxID=2816950 RepID=A0A975CEY2_9BURK|nr:UPF0149 family protein [Ottowia testudinis]QTD45155.1 UPF0149 family protein [Ottowia testudinis]
MTDPGTTPPADTPASDALAYDEATVATLEALDETLDELRERDDDVPQWEFCEGFLTAMLCARRQPTQDEWLPLLLGGGAAGPQDLGPFESAGQRTRFLMNWLARETQIRAALDARVETLDDPRSLDPATIDWRGMISAAPAEATDDAPDDEPDPDALPSYAQLWALGFLAAVEAWDDDWAPPRDKEIAADMADALDCIATLADDDRAPPRFNLFDENAPPSVSEQRMNDFGEALWAVYDLHAIGKSLGPRVAPAQSSKVGRNDPCPCGSGKKYKKCCGA